MQNKFYHYIQSRFHKYRTRLPKMIYLLESRGVIFFSKGRQKYELVESSAYHDCKSRRMTERALELSFLLDELEKWNMESHVNPIVEVGAVTPYVFPGLIKDIVDAADPHTLVNRKVDLFECDFHNQNVVSISTIEHVGTGEYGLEKRSGAPEALEKIYNESKHCFITWPIGYNIVLDKFVYENYKSIVEVYKRGKYDNLWTKVASTVDVFNTPYDKNRFADAVAIIKK